MMATNLPSALDEALLRPGRIDCIYHVGRRVEARLERLAERTRELRPTTGHMCSPSRTPIETHKTITGDDIVAVAEGTQGPIVDGRIYTLPEFRAAIDGLPRTGCGRTRRP
jgi:cell division protease FtsH